MSELEKNATGTRYVHNEEQNGVEIYFQSKPDADTREILKLYKWRWNKNKGCWYNRYNEENYKFAESICEEKKKKSIRKIENKIECKTEEKIENDIVMGEIPIDFEERRFPDSFEENLEFHVMRESVDAQIVFVIKEIIDRFGIEIFNNVQKASGMFSDLLESRVKERNVIRIALRSGAVEIMLHTLQWKKELSEVEFKVALRKMTDNYGINEKDSKLVLRSFYHAFSVYIKDKDNKDSGKKTCEVLRNLRIAFAKANDIAYEEKRCNSAEPCTGTCPYCESKTQYLMDEIQRISKVREIVYPQVDISEKQSVKNSCGVKKYTNMEKGRMSFFGELNDEKGLFD